MASTTRARGVRIPRLVPELPRAAWVVLGADAVSAVGSGLTLPFLFVYLHSVRNLAVGWAGLAISTVALAGLLGNPVGGYLADRIGARNALVCGLGVAAAGSAALAGAGSVGMAFAACGLVGVGVAVIWPSQDALLAELAGAAQRSGVFAVRHATMNLGLAIGAATSGLLADVSEPASFVHMYLLDSLSFLLLVPLLLRFVRPVPVARERSVGAFRQAMRDRAFRWVWVWALVLVALGAAQFHAAFPAYATGQGGLSAGQLGIVYAANSAAVLVFQLPVLRFMAGRRRTRGMSLVCLFWAAAWALTLVADSRLVVFALAMVVFAVGETFLAPTAAPLVNDLASAELRGRYNGLYALAFTAGFVVGPAMCGLVLAAGAASAFLVACAVVLCVTALATPCLERLLPANVNGVGGDA